MTREYNNGSYKPRTVIERGVRKSYEQGTLSRGDVTCFNIKRRALGLPTVSLEGCKEPSAAVVALAAAAKRARAKPVSATAAAKAKAKIAAAKASAVARKK